MNERSETGSLAGEYIAFVIQDEEYAVKTSQTMGVVNTPIIRRVPKAPPFVAGVANITGRIVPLLSAIERFGLSGNTEEAQKKLVLIQLGSSLYGLMVDRILPIIYLSEEIIEPMNPLMVKKEAPFLAGIARVGERLIYLLNMDAFISAELDIDREERKAYEGFAAKLSELLRQPKVEESHRFVSLSIADEEYGVDISKLNKVIPLEGMEKVGGVPDYIAGVVKAEEGIFPVIDLQRRFDLAPVPYEKGSRVAIVDAGNYSYGIVANSVAEVLDIKDEEIKDITAFTYADDFGHIKGVGMLEEGERLVMLLDETRILEGKEVRILSEMDDISMSQKIWEQRRMEAKELFPFLIFKVAHIEFAFNLRDLSEVIQYKEPTRVPKAPPFIRGIVPVRGELVSVLDLRRRLDITGKENTSGARIIVIRRGGSRCGVVADSVSEILNVSKEDIVSPSEAAEGIDPRFVDGIILVKQTDRSLIILNIENILDGK
jgi:purine-binding chemotaxis protein CheW